MKLHPTSPTMMSSRHFQPFTKFAILHLSKIDNRLPILILTQ